MIATLGAVAALAAGLGAGAPGALAHRGPRACHATHAHVGQASRHRLMVAVVCLLNRHRRAHGLAPLHRRHRLAVAALRHARAMERRRFFSHTSPGGATFVDRIRRAGYLRGNRWRSWSLGETLAWGSGRAATPAGLVRALMHSPPHRRIILDAVFRDVGVGLTAGDPVRAPHGATLTVDFGRRAARHRHARAGRHP